MASLDLCNRYLEERGSRLETCVNTILDVKSRLKRANWQVEESDPLRITICAPEGETGQSLAERLREKRIECEYADDTHLVLMVTPENAAEDLEAVVSALGENPAAKRVLSPLPIARGEQMVSIRQALFASHELVSAEQALGRICGTPTVSCPPAIPIAVSGERITAETVELFRYYGVNEIDVLK
jgi:arginine/lysine/ornithine decarboxylase